MKTILQGTFILIVVALIILVAFGLTFSLFCAIAVGLGYLLRWALPVLSLFEATLLSTMLGVIAIYVLTSLARGFLSEELMGGSREGSWSDDEADRDSDHQVIPRERFFKKGSERTWDAWLRAELANDIYAELQDTPNAVSHLNATQTQELSIRLAEAGINVIKRKTGRTRHLTVSVNDLRRELNRMGQRAYEDEILMLALAAINMNLNYYNDPLREVIREQQWDELAEIPEGDA